MINPETSPEGTLPLNTCPSENYNVRSPIKSPFAELGPIFAVNSMEA